MVINQLLARLPKQTCKCLLLVQRNLLINVNFWKHSCSTSSKNLTLRWSRHLLGFYFKVASLQSLPFNILANMGTELFTNPFITACFHRVILCQNGFHTKLSPSESLQIAEGKNCSHEDPLYWKKKIRSLSNWSNALIAVTFQYMKTILLKFRHLKYLITYSEVTVICKYFSHLSMLMYVVLLNTCKLSFQQLKKYILTKKTLSTLYCYIQCTLTKKKKDNVTHLPLVKLQSVPTCHYVWMHLVDKRIMNKFICMHQSERNPRGNLN